MSKIADWRKHLPVHPAAELFPLMSEAELKELAADIEKNGLKEKVKLVEDENGNYSVLDGRNRLDALELNGRTDLFDSQGRPNDAVFYRKDLGDPVAYVISRNIHRRHLTAEGKREVIAALLKLEPEKSDRQIAAMVHADRSKTVAPIRKELEDVAAVRHVETRTDTKGRKQPVKKQKPRLPSYVPTAAFADAVHALLPLMSQPSARFAGIVPAGDLEMVANFLVQVAGKDADASAVPISDEEALAGTWSRKDEPSRASQAKAGRS